MEEPIIRIENLSYTYTAGERALNSIDLDIARGEYVAVVGANGAGKTTLCLHLNGILPIVLGGKMGGAIWVRGEEPCEQHVYDMAQHVGVVLQDPETQLFAADVQTEVAFAAENQGVPREEMVDLIDWALDVVRLSDYKETSPEHLSGGQKQRLVIAANLVVRPEILVLDEPTSQLDPIGTLEVFSTLQELNEDLGMTILVATHKCDQIAEYADRIVVLEDGEMILADEPRRVFAQVPDLRRALVSVPEVGLLDYELNRREAEQAGQNLDQSTVKIEVDEVYDDIVDRIQDGGLTPLSSFEGEVSRPVAEAEATSEHDVIVDISDVSYSYSKGAELALKGVSAKIRRGEFVGIIGQNGAGKTTLMKCITGLLRPNEGSIRIDGNEVSDLSAKEIARHVGLILQNPDNQLFQMSTEEEIAFGLRNLGLGEEEIQERIDQTLELTGLEEFRNIYPFKLSLGDRRKLAVAAIYAMHPSILIFDEPTTGQDYKGRYQLCNLAARLNRQGATVMMITHDMSLIARYTQRTFVMGKGTILLDAPTRDVFYHEEELESTFLEPPSVVGLAHQLESYGVPHGIVTVEELYYALTGEQLPSEDVIALEEKSEGAHLSPVEL